MNWLGTDVFDFRHNQKRILISGSIIFIFLATYVSCRPSDGVSVAYNDEEKYSKIDSIEWQHIKLDQPAEDHGQHPVIYYKEDFVSEDYDPVKESEKQLGSYRKEAPSRRFKVISWHHRYNRNDTEKNIYLKPEKVLFDVLPNEESISHDSKFDGDSINIEVISLVDNQTTNPKQILSKRPKKYSHSLRKRRDLGALAIYDHSIQKRTPYQYSEPVSYNQVAPNAAKSYVKHPVRGNYYNPVSLPIPPRVPNLQTPSVINRFGGEDETDRVVWGISFPRQPARAQTSLPSRRTPPLIHNPNPIAEGELSISTRDSIDTQTTMPPRRIPPPLFHDPNPQTQEASQSQLNPVQPITSPPETEVFQSQQTTKSPTEQVNISQCVWAIVSCCSRDNLNIRYDCFDQMGCMGAFWGLNPCADNIQKKAITAADNYLQ